MALTNMQRKFARHFAETWDVEVAAERAGYEKASVRTLRKQMNENGELRREIGELSGQLLEAQSLTPEKTVIELCRIAFGNILDVVSWDAHGNLEIIASDKITREQAANIASIEQKFGKNGEPVSTAVKFHSKLKALETLAKIQQMYHQTNVHVHMLDPRRLAQMPEHERRQQIEQFEQELLGQLGGARALPAPKTDH